MKNAALHDFLVYRILKKCNKCLRNCLVVVITSILINYFLTELIKKTNRERYFWNTNYSVHCALRCWSKLEIVILSLECCIVMFINFCIDRPSYCFIITYSVHLRLTVVIKGICYVRL